MRNIQREMISGDTEVLARTGADRLQPRGGAGFTEACGDEAEVMETPCNEWLRSKRILF